MSAFDRKRLLASLRRARSRRLRRARASVSSVETHAASLSRAELEELRRKSETQEAKLHLIREVSKASMATYELDALLAFYLELILRRLQATSGSLMLLDHEAAEVIFRAEGGEDSVGGRACQDPLPEQVATQVIERGEASLSPSFLRLPLKAVGKVVGFLELHRNGRDFNEDDLDLLEPVVHQVAIVVQNALLFTDSQRKLEQLRTLMELSAIVNSTLELKEVLHRAMGAIVRLMECEVGSLLLLDEKSQELVFEVALGNRGERVKEALLKTGEGIAGWVTREGKPLLINDVRGDPRFFVRGDEQTGFVTRNILSIPIKSRRKVVGVLQAINKLNGKSFVPEEVDLFTSLANQVAVALENARLYGEVREAFLSTVKALADAIEKRDPYTGGHIKRVEAYAVATGRVLNLTPKELEILRLGAILHDVGKIGVDDAVLRKRASLDEDEYRLMQQHTVIGAEIIAHVKHLHDVIPAIRHHQERMDGRGYPDGLKGEEIPLIARIIAVVDAFDAMTTDRPYRRRLSDEAALAELQRCSRTQFDPAVVEAFVKAYVHGAIKGSGSVELGRGPCEEGAIGWPGEVV